MFRCCFVWLRLGFLFCDDCVYLLWFVISVVVVCVGVGCGRVACCFVVGLLCYCVYWFCVVVNVVVCFVCVRLCWCVVFCVAVFCAVLSLCWLVELWCV